MIESKEYSANGVETVSQLIEFLKQFDGDAEVSGEGVAPDFWKFVYNVSSNGEKQLYFDL